MLRRRHALILQLNLAMCLNMHFNGSLFSLALALPPRDDAASCLLLLLTNSFAVYPGFLGVSSRWSRCQTTNSTRTYLDIYPLAPRILSFGGMDG